MAANSPVVLDSSSPPPAFRHPSITPQKSAEANVSSSPGLPELSSFFNAKARTSAPAAAPKAAPALPGFTSAGTLWKAAALEAERKDQEGRSHAGPTKGYDAEKKNTGKLARSVSKVQTEDKTATATASRTRTPSISLSEFDFKPEDSPGRMQPPAVSKKAGKRADKPGKDDSVVKVKKATGKANDGSHAGSKERKRTANVVADSGELSVRNVDKPSAPAPSALAETAATVTETGTTRRPSITLSEFSYQDEEPAVLNAGHHASAFFSPATSTTSGSHKHHWAKGAEAAKERDRKLISETDASDRKAAGPSAAPTNKPDLISESTTRRSSASVFEFGNQSDIHPAEIETAAVKPANIKKPRKRTADAKGAPAKKPKKQFAKSASIILNSDEPDSVAADDALAADPRRPSIEDTQAAVYVQKPKKAVKQAKQSEKERLEAPAETGFGVWSQSAYFNSVPVSKTIETDATIEALQTVFPINGNVENAPQESETIGRPASPGAYTSISRRRSWTPAKNTYETLDPEVDSPGESPAARKSLADLVGGFSYDQPAQVPTRNPAGEPLIKKRRIEVDEHSAVISAPRKVAAVKEKVKKTKAPKKKPQTITDLATKAYRPEEEETQNGQASVSEFFAAQKEDHIASVAPSEIAEAPPIFKKPRKPRAKKVDGEASAVKKTPKPKKVKVKFNEAKHVPPLFSPQQARAVEKKQGFLFGTSSQLAFEEDVDYVRDLQMAIFASEEVDAPPASPRQLMTKVSVGHTERRLFWSASRDSWGHVIAANGIKRKAAVAVPLHLATVPARVNEAAVQGPRADSTLHAEPLAQEVANKKDATITSVEEASLEDVHNAPHQDEDSQVVDLCGTSPIAVIEDDLALVEAVEPQSEQHHPEAAVETLLPAPNAAGVDDSWMLLDSGESESEEDTQDTSQVPFSHLSKTRPGPEVPAASQQHRVAFSPPRLSQARPALTTLDSNIPMHAQTSPLKQQRAFLSQQSAGPATSPQRIKSKTKASTTAAALSPKRRGRPPKSTSPLKHTATQLPTFPASQPPVSSDFVAIDDISDSASDDLPLKDVVAARIAPPTPKRRGRPPKASQHSPMTSRAPSPSKSSFVNLDDISDSDAGKQTPSPRRRRAGTASPVQTLEMSPSACENFNLPPIVDGKAAIKPSDPCWIPISNVLFPQVSAVVKSTKPCGDNGELSWWEKILMYDPIVLEDLTAWLVSRGVGVEVRRKAIKEKKKGKKKKGGIVEEEVVQVEEFEVVKEELRGWMVQKWCEEKSICCLWREGLRGGVKVRY